MDSASVGFTVKFRRKLLSQSSL